MKNGGLVSNAGGVALDGVRGLVTGANRGLGRAFVDELLERDACVVYAAARNADSVAVDDDRIVPVTLDVTNAADVEAAAAACGDSTLVINNAGLMLASALHFGAQRGCGAWRNGDQLLRNPGSRASLRTRARREWWWRTGEHAHAHDEWHRQVI